MKNPWTTISWDNLIADCDKEALDNLKEKKRSKIQTSTLPEPFMGNVRSNVVLLIMNPGKEDDNFYRSVTLLNKIMDNLCHTARTFMWLDEEILDESGNVHGGCKWWHKRTKCLRKENLPANFFVLQFFPYHSTRGMNFPKLPSDEYRNQLLSDAMDNGKLIVIMRAKNRWFGIKENNLGERLRNYSKKIILASPQNVTLSPNNMKDNWHLFETELKKAVE